MRSCSRRLEQQRVEDVREEEVKIRFEIQFSRMYCQTFSAGFNSGALAGSGTSVMLSGTTSLFD